MDFQTLSLTSIIAFAIQLCLYRNQNKKIKNLPLYIAAGVFVLVVLVSIAVIIINRFFGDTGYVMYIAFFSVISIKFGLFLAIGVLCARMLSRILKIIENKE